MILLPAIIKNSKYRNLFVTLLLSLILITIVTFHRRHVHKPSYLPLEQNTTKKNDIHNKEHFPRIYQPVSLSILRGITIFYPHNQEDNFLSELLWFFHSWIEMMKYEPSSWRTDLIIYTGNFTLNLQQLGCIYNRLRINRHEPAQCRVFPYEPINLRDIGYENNAENYSCRQIDKKRSILLKQHLRTYEYIDSINIIAECYPSFSMYDHILRTDSDTFLTPNFGRFVPYNNSLLVGRGGYSTAFNTARLRRIAKDMNWFYANRTNIGSTW